MDTPSNTSPSRNKRVDEIALDEERAKAALAAWIQQHRGLYDIFLDAICVVDVTNRVVDFNTAFMELCGESYRKVLKIGDFCELVKTELCPDGCPSRQIVSSGKPLRLDELVGSSKAFPNLNMIMGGVPLQSPTGETIGSMITIRNVSAETELQKKYDERKKESIIDGLTRIYNKVYTENLLLRCLKTGMRDSQGISVIMCDIDHFKKVNDTYGHQAGDHVLANVAGMLQKSTRETDAVGRFGGEEFIVLLTNTDPKGALIWAERFRKLVAGTELSFDGKPIPLTISLGTASFAEKWAPGFSAEAAVKELVNRADTALYFAKANGRNQACQFETLPKNRPTAPKKEAA